jgi:uncharacterized protein (TIRG00374 family)
MAYPSAAEKPSSGRRRSIEFAVRIGITAALLALLLRKTDLTEVIYAVAKIGVDVFLLATGIFVLLALLVAVRWRLIILSLGHSLSFYESWRLVMIGLFFNQCLPSGIGGDVARIVLAARLGVPRGPAVVSVVVDRLFALAAVGLFMLAGLWCLPWGQPLLVDAVLSSFVAAGFVILLGLDRGLALVERYPAIVQSSPWRKLQPLIEFGRMVSRTFQLVLHRGGPARTIIWTSLINQLALGGIVFLIGARLDPGLRLIDALLLFPPAMLLSMLPISLGGWGIREGSMVLFLGAAGVSSTAALAISLSFGIAMILAGAIGGIMWLVQPRASTHPPAMAAVSSQQ